MRILVLISCTVIVITTCVGINFIDVPLSKVDTQKHVHSYTRGLLLSSTVKGLRRHGYIEHNKANIYVLRAGVNEEDKDLNLKNKISTLVQQTLHDTERKIKSIQQLKENNRDKDPYRVGFILSMVKKTRDVLNELFNVAVKHRDDWKALEQLKIFELIVHTNVDTTNLVRQLVEIHVMHLNATNSRNVVLL